jgi:EAL domain-containing protein (putative c-di-GMP-specific phosphodiesterase class I)
VDILKIDRSFTADVDTDERADALVRSMVLMGGALGLRVVAEGIERPGQLERVCRTGCSAGQGYLFSPPRPLKEIVALLEAEHDEQSWLKDIMLAAAPAG